MTGGLLQSPESLETSNADLLGTVGANLEITRETSGTAQLSDVCANRETRSTSLTEKQVLRRCVCGGASFKVLTVT